MVFKFSFYLFEGGYFKSFYKGSPQNFLLCKNFIFGSSSTLMFGIEGSSLVLNHHILFLKFFHLEKESLWVVGLFTFIQTILFYQAHVIKFFQNPSLHFGSSQISNPSKFNPFLTFIPFILSPKLFMSFILDLGDLQRRYLTYFEF